jgi:Rod binding domain-containing protein
MGEIAQPGSPSPGELEKVSQEFEALLMRQMVEAMRKTTGAEESEGNQMVDHLIEDSLANHLARSGGIGLAKSLTATVGGGEIAPHQINPLPNKDMHLVLERSLRFPENKQL